jgi:hypothetical protein
MSKWPQGLPLQLTRKSSTTKLLQQQNQDGILAHDGWGMDVQQAVQYVQHHASNDLFFLFLQKSSWHDNIGNNIYHTSGLKYIHVQGRVYRMVRHMQIQILNSN